MSLCAKFSLLMLCLLKLSELEGKMDVRPDVFKALQCMDLDVLTRIPVCDLRPVLPTLVRMIVIGGCQVGDGRKRLFKCISGIDDANSVTNLLSADFASLQDDLGKEFKMWLVIFRKFFLIFYSRKRNFYPNVECPQKLKN